jgi:hypothetical protein
MTVEKWASNSRYPNQGYVNLKICIPQSSECQTIDHVLVDTGSYGLRLMSSALTVGLPQVTINSQPLAECTHFVSGYTWRGIFLADISLGSDKASSVPIQVINGNYGVIPSSCSNSGGASINSVAALGANGILGIGSFTHDCPSCAAQAQSGRYYTCTSGSCTSTAVPLSAQVVNPVFKLAANNNGVVIDLPAPSSSGQNTLSGKLIFGIGNTTNNTPTNQTVFALDSNGFLTTTYGAGTYSSSYIDSGSNGIFFADSTIKKCSGSSGFYCPTSSLSKNAEIVSGSARQVIGFSIAATSSFGVQPNLAGTGSSFAWGLPFFYGRKVFVSISGQSAFGSTTPAIAF